MLGPFAIDTYLPSFPAIGAELDAGPAAVQATLTVYLLALALGQPLFGPVSDAVGRRGPLLAGMALFVLGSVAAALAPTLTALIAARVVQGLGGALAVVVANSSVRDVASGPAAARMFAVLLTVGAIGPMVAPAVGGVLEESGGWRAVFAFLAVLGVAVGVLALVALPESLPARRRTRLQTRALVAGYARTLADRRYVVAMLALTSAFAGLFAFLGGSPYVLQGEHGLSPAAFGLFLGGTSVALVVGAQVGSRLTRRLRVTTIAFGGSLLIVGGITFALLTAWAGVGLWPLVAGIVIMQLGMGVGEPALMSAAMSTGEADAGVRAALIGAGQYLAAAAVVPLAGAVAAMGSAAWLALVLGAFAVSLALVVVVALRGR